MRPVEQGFLLLTSHLGDLQRPVLTVAQMRALATSVRQSEIPNKDRTLETADLMALGYNASFSQRVVDLLAEDKRLESYLFKAHQTCCVPVTRVTQGYPLLLHHKLGLDCPGVLWGKGDLSLLQKPAIALVGSRDLRSENRLFAREAGKQAAQQGYVLISGNARGADREAQESCLAHGGQVISIVADALQDHPKQENVLYLAEDSYDLPFSSHRALSRNRLIHAMGKITLVAQSSLEKGGSWRGAVENLRHGYSVLGVFYDGSIAAHSLIDRGAKCVTLQELSDLSVLFTEEQNSFSL